MYHAVELAIDAALFGTGNEVVIEKTLSVPGRRFRRAPKMGRRRPIKVRTPLLLQTTVVADHSLPTIPPLRSKHYPRY